MKILYDHQVFSLQNAGGQSRYFYELCKFLATVPEVRTKVWLGISGTVYPFRRLDGSKAQVRYLPQWLGTGMARYVANELWSNTLALFGDSLDVYHPTNLMRMPMVKARRLVVTHHDCTHEKFPEFFPDVKKIYWARKRLFPRADAIICVSEACRQDLLQFYNVDAAKTRVIHHGLTPFQRSATGAAQLRQHVRRDYLLYVGMRPGFKNFPRLLQAFRDSRLCESCDLLVLGGSPLTADERSIISRLGIGGEVVWVPRASDELLAEAYGTARVFVYPSLSEGFGFPPLEALSLGCPVLASRLPCILEVCKDAPFYFDPGDQASFTRELLRAASDEDARRRSAQRGREVTSQYTWEKCGSETLALYRACQ